MEKIFERKANNQPNWTELSNISEFEEDKSMLNR